MTPKDDSDTLCLFKFEDGFLGKSVYELDAALQPVDAFVFSSFVASSFIILGESVIDTGAELITDDDPAFVLVSPTPEVCTGEGLVTPDPSLACDSEDS